jgi:hypothetical protein
MGPIEMLQCGEILPLRNLLCSDLGFGGSRCSLLTEATQLHIAARRRGSTDVRGARSRPIPVIGFLACGSPDAYSRVTAAFLQGLKQTGYGERQIPLGGGSLDRLPRGRSFGFRNAEMASP